jgi:hypothetical protein
VEKLKPWLVPALVLVGMALTGIAIGAVGTALRVPWCLGGGSECDGIKPVSETAGRIFEIVGGFVFWGSAIVAGLVAWRLRIVRGRADATVAHDGDQHS